MTRKDYERTAAVIRERVERFRRSSHDTEREYCTAAIATLADDMADMFAAENPRFDRERFLSACGVA